MGRALKAPKNRQARAEPKPGLGLDPSLDRGTGTPLFGVPDNRGPGVDIYE